MTDYPVDPKMDALTEGVVDCRSKCEHGSVNHQHLIAAAVSVQNHPDETLSANLLQKLSLLISFQNLSVIVGEFVQQQQQWRVKTL